MRAIMSLIQLMRRMSPLIVLGAAMSSAYALPPQAVAPVKLPHGGRGVDGPFFPATRAAPVDGNTGAALQ
ncbi:2-oxoglutarate dehydrogenase, partial [Burkholderia cenocepacia]|nr:2-oxoglutarate dehydrogenase [Burkholderia cenocepacia]